MTRRLLSVCVGAALVGMLSVPAHGIAKPPDLPEDGTFTVTPPCELPRRATRPSDLLEDGTFTATPVMSPLALLFQLRPTARRTLAGSLLFGIHPALGLLPTENILDAPCDHPPSRTEDDVLSDVPREPARGQSEGWHEAHYDIVGGLIRVKEERERNYEWEWWKWLISHWSARQLPPRAGDDVLNDAPPRDLFRISGGPEMPHLSPSQYGDWFSWLLAHWTARQQLLAPEQNEGCVQSIATSVDSGYRVAQELDNVLDAPREHPQPATDAFLTNMPKCTEIGIVSMGGGREIEEIDWWKWLLAIITAQQQLPTPEESEGYLHPTATGMDFACQVVQELDNTQEDIMQEGIRIFVGYEGAVNYNFGDEATNDSDSLPPPSIEILPMPHEDSDITCPYLRQQMIGKHACQLADPEIGRDVLANLEHLREADDLLELAKELARDGFVAEAMVCCGIAEKLCPGSPCAQRAADTMHELARGIVPSTTDTEESAEPQPDEPTGPCSQCDSLWRQLFESIGLSQTWSSDGMTLPNPNYMRDSADLDPGVELMVCGLMKACHLLMSQGMQHQAAELARQAYALDPQRVMADPLLYKIHLLAESPMPTPAGLSEEKEPPTCPYCPSIGKTIREIVPEKKKKSTDRPGTLLVPPQPPIDYEVVPVLDDELSQTAGSEEGGVSSLREFAETFMAGIGGSPLEFHTDAEGGLSLSAECSLGGNVYHLRYRQGCLAIWKTTDASTMKP